VADIKLERVFVVATHAHGAVVRDDLQSVFAQNFSQKPSLGVSYRRESFHAVLLFGETLNALGVFVPGCTLIAGFPGDTVREIIAPVARIKCAPVRDDRVLCFRIMIYLCEFTGQVCV
jgi:hypothetical protein